MNIAIFGGTFDPVHRGHIELATAAQQRCALKQVLFVPAYVPPHKRSEPITRFEHRFAMLALALADHKDFLPSLLDVPEKNENESGRNAAPAHAKAKSHGSKTATHGADESSPSYSIDTVRRLKKQLGKSDRLFYLIGIDAFVEIANWREADALLRECEFIVGSRPRFTLAKVAEALPESLRPSGATIKPFQKQPAAGELVLPGVHLHLLEGVNVPISATQVRAAAVQGKGVSRFLPPPVAEYIRKMGLYRPHSKKHGP